MNWIPFSHPVKNQFNILSKISSTEMARLNISEILHDLDIDKGVPKQTQYARK